MWYNQSLLIQSEVLAMRFKKKYREQVETLDPEAVEAVKQFNQSPEGEKAKQAGVNFAKTIRRLKRSAELARSKDVETYRETHTVSTEEAKAQITEKEIDAMYKQSGVTPKNKNRVTRPFGQSYTLYSSSPHIPTTTTSPTSNNKMIGKTK